MDFSSGLRKLFGLEAMLPETQADVTTPIRSAPVQTAPTFDPIEQERLQREQLLRDALQNINGNPVKTGHEPITPSVGVRG